MNCGISMRFLLTGMQNDYKKATRHVRSNFQTPKIRIFELQKTI